MPVDGVWGPIIRRFGVPPWRVALHILLLVLVTMQVLQRNTQVRCALLTNVCGGSTHSRPAASQMALYRRRSEAAWQGLLYPPWAADTPADPLSFPGNVFYLYTAEDVERTMVYMVEAFDQMSTVTIDRVDTKPPPHLIVSTDTETSAVAIDSVAALRNQFGNDTAAFVGSADTLTLAFALESVDVVAGVSSACVMWSVDVLFTIHLGSVTVAPVYGSQTCTSNSGWSSVSSLLIVEVAVSIVAAAHMFAMLLSWTRSARLMYVLYLLQKGYSRKDGKHRRGVTATGFASLSVSHGSATGRGGNGDGTTGGSASAHRESRRAVHALMSPSAIDLRSAKRVAFVAGTKTRVAAPQGLLLAIDDETAMSLSRAQLLASQLTFSDVLPVLQIVNGLLFIANATLIAHNVTSFTEGEASVSAGWALPLALAVAAVWATFLQYLKFSARYYMLIRTLNYGLPRIAQFLVGVAPIFISFCLFGMVVFGPRTFRFSNFSQTAITLFAVMNGDVMRETYLMVIGLQKGWFLRALSQLYLYAFVCLFIYVGTHVLPALWHL